MWPRELEKVLRTRRREVVKGKERDTAIRHREHVESIIIIVTWQDEFVRLAGAHKHPRSVVGAREMDLSAGRGAPECFEGAEC